MTDSNPFERPYYDRKGNPITLKEWGRIYKSKDKIVEQTSVGDFFVSTVWLGVNYGFEARPVIYETMVFGEHGSVYVERYCTEDEAIEGHKRICEKVKSGEIGKNDR